MTSAGVRRAAAVTSIAGLVASGVALAAAPVGAAPGHQARPAAKLLYSAISSISVVPGSTTTWVMGQEQTTATTTYFAAVRTTGGFKRVKITKVGVSDNLQAIAAASAKSIFVIGEANLKTGSVALLEHSVGGAFRPMKLPKFVTSVSEISASSATNVVALIGMTKVVKGVTTGSAGLMRWNGHAWKITPLTKAVLGAEGVVYGNISTSGPTSTWFVLQTETAAGYESVRFTGHGFIKKPIKIPANTGIQAIVAGSPTSVWVFGTESLASGGQIAFTEHFTGSGWHPVAVPKQGYYTTAGSIAAAGPKAYLVGYQYPKNIPAKGLPAQAWALSFKAGHWRPVSHVRRGVTSTFGLVAASSKQAVISGTSYNGYQCGPKQVTSTPYIVTVRASSGVISLAPKLRTAGVLAPAIGYRPSRPAC